MRLVARLLMMTTVLICLSCNDNGRDELHFEKQVMEQIFPSLIDSMYVKAMALQTPSPVKENDEENDLGVDYEEQAKDKIRKNLAAGKKKNQKIILLVNEVIHAPGKSDMQFVSPRYRLPENTSGIAYSLKDLNVQMPDSIFTIIHSKDELKQNPFQQVLAEFSFSRILFNINQDAGLLICNYVCGRLCGGGYQIFIKKETGRWIIDRVVLIWVS